MKRQAEALVLIAKELSNEQRIKELVEEHGEELVEKAVENILKKKRARLSNPALNMIQKELSEMGSSDPYEDPEDEFYYKETSEEKAERERTKSEALKEADKLGFIPRILKKMNIHFSEMPGYVFDKDGTARATPSRQKFDSELAEKVKQKTKSKGEPDGDKLWTKKEWETYRRKHPKTKIKPKFK